MSSDEPSLSGAAPGSTPQPSCPAFLSKLWLLVGDESTDDLIHWSDEGNSFIVEDQVVFAQILLPQFFKHNNMASFIRQLNMYGFRKKAHLDDGALKTERTDIEFQHAHFLKGEIKQLELIKRKVSGKDESKVKSNEVGKILSEVREMKGKQHDITSKLESMKVENTALWREVVGLRQKHEKQQKIVNRLIHFLISLVQPKPKVGSTRKRPLSQQLMIEGLPDSAAPSKAKFSRTLPGGSALDGLQVRGLKQQESNLDFLSRADSPTLTDIIDNVPSQSKVTELLEEQVEEEDGLNPSNIPLAAAAMSSIPIAQDPVNQDQQAGVAELLSQGYVLESYESPTTAVTTTASAAIASPESLGSQAAPSASIPVQTALSPNVTYPLTPTLEDPEWLDLEEDQPADVVGLESAGVEGLGMSTGEDGGGLFGPGEGQLVLTSQSPTDEREQSQEDNPNRVIQRLLSNEEQKQDLGEQLNTVQSNLNDFKQLIATNPSLNFELGELLSDFHVLFDDSGTITIPDAPTNYDNLQTDENGKNEDVSSPSVIPAGNELVTYKPSTSYSSLNSFMADDEDSLLRSLDDDSLALRDQKENDGLNFLL